MNYKWSEIRYLPICKLRTNPMYKRHLNMNWLNHIINNFDVNLVGLPWVSYRNGSFFILDGQHLVKALGIKFNEPSYPVLCKVFYGFTEKDETELCIKLQTAIKPLDTFSSIKMQTFNGDQATRTFRQCTAKVGFAINRTNQRNSGYNIRAIKKAQECFNVLGAEKYEFMLSTLLKTWDGAAWSVSSKMLDGMCLLIRSTDVNQKQFVKKLSCFTENDINDLAFRHFKHQKRNRIAWVLGMLYDENIDFKMLDLI